MLRAQSSRYHGRLLPVGGRPWRVQHGSATVPRMTTTQRTVGIYLACILAAIVLLALTIEAVHDPVLYEKRWAIPRGVDL